jgi:hypothetical protein
MTEQELRYAIMDKTTQKIFLETEIHILQQELAELLCPFKVGDIVINDDVQGKGYHVGRFKVRRIFWRHGRSFIVGQSFKKNGELGLRQFDIGYLQDFRKEEI